LVPIPRRLLQPRRSGHDTDWYPVQASIPQIRIHAPLLIERFVNGWIALPCARDRAEITLPHRLFREPERTHQAIHDDLIQALAFVLGPLPQR
ncbi:MAG: hypothetical protein L0H83_15485, partial [Salinisphaera sp.]|nr:hypothetical protein [Salinisphaera sp.]